jgi:hypothetical protein
MVCRSQAKQSRNLLLSVFLVLALSITAFPQRDLNKETPKESPTVKPTPAVRKRKPPKVKPLTESSTEVATSKEIKPTNAESRPTGNGSIMIELAALKVDPYDDPDLHILINGVELADKKKKSETRIEFEKIPNGLYTLMVKHPTIDDWKQEIEIKIGIGLYLLPTLNIKRGILIIEGEPGAKVFIDDKQAAVIGEDGEAVIYPLIGQRSLKIIKDGQKPFQKTIFIMEGENFEKIEKIL